MNTSVNNTNNASNANNGVNEILNASIDEQVKAIMKTRMSKSEKRESLIKLGLRPMDVTLIFFADDMANREARQAAAARRRENAVRRREARLQAEREAALRAIQAMPMFTFGVEIECNVSSSRLMAAARQTGMNVAYEHYNHCTRNHFKMVTDASLRGANPIECVSPVLDTAADGLETLKVCCDTLNRAEAKVNVSCGLHVHIGARAMSDEQYCNVFVNYMHLEGLIDSFMAPSRRNNSYAKSLRGSGLEFCSTKAGISSCLNHDRYHKVNPISIERHCTIEFRQHQGSTDYTKISKWVAFCGKLVAWSRNNRLTADVTNIDGIEFLNDEEKTFFKGRIEEMRRRAVLA